MFLVVLVVFASWFWWFLVGGASPTIPFLISIRFAGVLMVLVVLVGFARFANLW